MMPHYSASDKSMHYLCANSVADPDANEYVRWALFGGDDRVPVNAAPGGNILQRAGIRRDYLEFIAGLQSLDEVLGPDHRHGADEVAGVEPR